VKLKDVIKMIEILGHYAVDEHNNWRPDIKECLRLLDIERLVRLGQRTNMKDNFERGGPY